jgi:hypothetical protein
VPIEFSPGLATAKAVFAHAGTYETMEDFDQAAGVAKRNLSRCFSPREHMFAAIVASVNVVDVFI